MAASRWRPAYVASKFLAGWFHMSVTDHRGLAKKIKFLMPKQLFEFCRTVYNNVMALVPFRIKYGLGGYLRRHKIPYSLLQDGDIAVQVGAPRDILHAGRSRAIYFAMFVGKGKVVVIEPDAENCREFRRFVGKHGLRQSVEVFECGAWSENTTLSFLSSSSHPASSTLEEVAGLPAHSYRELGYERVTVNVRTIDDLLVESAAPTPKLVSVTTNGAELKIVDGMKTTIARGLPYISLAATGNGYVEYMDKLGYEYFARDDRGFCFRRRDIRPSDP